jgi:hypothetical protein
LPARERRPNSIEDLTGTFTNVSHDVNPTDIAERFPIPCDAALCYVTSDADAVPTGLAPLLPHEFALGRATVRLDIYFQ